MRKFCKICLVETELDQHGRCRSCATALAATDAGMTYGKYVARYGCDPLAIVHTPQLTQDDTLRCLVCGTPIPVGGRRSRYCCKACAIQARRQAAADTYRARHPAPPRLCIVCGRQLDPALHKSITMCSDACRELRKNEQRRQRYIRQKEREEQHG